MKSKPAAIAPAAADKLAIVLPTIVVTSPAADEVMNNVPQIGTTVVVAKPTALPVALDSDDGDDDELAKPLPMDGNDDKASAPDGADVKKIDQTVAVQTIDIDDDELGESLLMEDDNDDEVIGGAEVAAEQVKSDTVADGGSKDDEEAAKPLPVDTNVVGIEQTEAETIVEVAVEVVHKDETMEAEVKIADGVATNVETSEALVEVNTLEPIIEDVNIDSDAIESGIVPVDDAKNPAVDVENTAASDTFDMTNDDDDDVKIADDEEPAQKPVNETEKMEPTTETDELHSFDMTNDEDVAAIEAAKTADANMSSIDLTDDNTFENHPTVIAALADVKAAAAAAPATPIAVIIIPDTPMPAGRPLDATFSPEPSTPPQAVSTTHKTVGRDTPLGALNVSILKPLKGIRKRSFSAHVTMQTLPTTASASELDTTNSALNRTAAVGANKSVCFHSPANQQMPIDQIDALMEQSRRDANALADKENNKPAAGGKTPQRRKRSLSMVEPDAHGAYHRMRPATPRRRGVDASAAGSPAVNTPKRTRIPDFKAIHQRTFERMESIQDYKKRSAAGSSGGVTAGGVHRTRIGKPSAVAMAVSGRGEFGVAFVCSWLGFVC